VPEEFAAGWHEGSAPLGVIGNTVLSGHHNAFGKVFANLIDVQIGDEIVVLSSTHEFYYSRRQ
jgi:sortase (surface protein transpeptidase)